MRVLLSNDDGINAKGLQALIPALTDRGHEVVVAAPKYEQSGMAHAMSVHRRIEVARAREIEEKFDVEAWSIDGTPTDCVKLYLEALQNPHKSADLIISGINHGANLATDVLYSGTVGAALEGFLHHIPALAVSLDKDSQLTYDHTAVLTTEFLEKLLAKESSSFFYNINFPVKLSQEQPEFVMATLGWRDYVNAFVKETDEDGRVYFNVAGEISDVSKEEPTDIWATKNGMIAVTPLSTDWLDHAKYVEST